MLRLALRSVLFSSLLAVPAACGGDDDGDGGDSSAADASTATDAAATADARPRADAAPPPDAMPADTTCSGDPLPSTADDPIAVSGEASTLMGFSTAPVVGATITLVQVADDQVIDTSVTDDDGAFSLEAETGADPLDIYVEGTADDFWPSRVYPPSPLVIDQSAPVPMLNQADRDLVFDFAGVTHEAGQGVIALALIDCEGNGVDGATVSITPSSGTVVYGSDLGIPSPDAAATAPSGLAYIFNVDPGEVEVDATQGGVSLREHTIEVIADGMVSTIITP